MACYTVRVLGPAGVQSRVFELDCADDDEVIETLGADPEPEAMEVWHGERLVARVPPLLHGALDG